MIPRYAEWRRDTNAGRLATRSDELETLDKKILAFETDRSRDAWLAVKTAFEAWKKAHLSGPGKSVDTHRRNAGGLLRALELEFTTAQSSSPTPSTISRIRAKWTGEPTPPGWGNLSEALINDRLDKAFADSRVVLRSVVGNLEKGGRDVDRLVKTWFGATGTRTAVLANFNVVRLGFDKFFEAGGLTLNIGLGLDSDSFVAAHESPHAQDAGKVDRLVFGKTFFNENVVFPTAESFGRPGASQEQLRALHAIGAPLHASQAKVKICALLKNVLGAKENKDFVAAEHGSVAPGAKVTAESTLGAAVGRSWAHARRENQNTFAAADIATLVDTKAAIESLGLRQDMSAGACRDQLPALLADWEGKVKALVAGDTSLQGAKCSASGAVIHELSHKFLETKDVDSPTLPGQKCYGSIRCLGLAACDSAKALTNADSYRLFAESLQFSL